MIQKHLLKQRMRIELSVSLLFYAVELKRKGLTPIRECLASATSSNAVMSKVAVLISFSSCELATTESQFSKHNLF